MDPLKRLLAYTRQYWQKLVVSIVAASLYGIVAAMPTYIVKHTVDDIFISHYRHLIMPFMLLFLAFFICKGLFSYITSYYMHWVGNKVVIDIRHDLFNKVIDFPLSFFKQHSTGELMSYFLNDIQMVQNASASAIRNGVRSFFEAFFLISFAFAQNWKLSMLMMVVGPLIGLTIRRMGKATKIASRAIQREMGSISSMLQEMFVGIREIKAFNAERFEVGRLTKQLDRCFSSIMNNIHIESLLPALIESIAMIGGVVAFYVATNQVLNGAISAGQLASFVVAVLLCYQPLKRVVSVYSEVQYGLAAAERIFSMMDQVYPALQNRTVEIKNFETALEFNDVSFSYQPEKPILEKVNFTIRRGECIGIVGPSGAGKSTLCDMLLGFLLPTSGSMTLDGNDFSTICSTSLRSKIGYVGQRTFLFNDTIRNNILYSFPNASDAAIEQACKEAYAHDFIEQLPHGYQTMVGEDGTLVSGGQKQRITIARALLKDPEILIFDEATSSLDHESEKMIQRTIQELRHKKTMLIVSHRMSFLEHVDRILVVQKGSVQEARDTKQAVASEVRL